jgi:hypothetical protein
LDQAQPAPKQLNLKSLAPGSPKMLHLWGGVQAGSNLVAVRRRKKPILEVACVFPLSITNPTEIGSKSVASCNAFIVKA